MLFAIVLSILLLVFLLFWFLLWKLPQWQVAAVSEVKDRIDLESKSRQTLVQIIGGAAALGALYFTAQTLRTSQATLEVNRQTLEMTQRTSQATLEVNRQTLEMTQRHQITERFTKAIEQLGDKDHLMIRLGGIYALERIARDSEPDHWVVMEVLTAFVRGQPPAKTMPPNKCVRTWDPTSKERKTKECLPSSDVQAILTVIGRRTRTFGNGETQELDLRNTNLQHAFLREAQLQHAFLREAQLQDAFLIEAQLQHAYLGRAQLQHAYLGDANLEDAYLDKANLRGANLSGVKRLTQDQINNSCTDENTILPEGLTRPAPCPLEP